MTHHPTRKKLKSKFISKKINFKKIKIKFFNKPKTLVNHLKLNLYHKKKHPQIKKNTIYLFKSKKKMNLKWKTKITLNRKDLFKKLNNNLKLITKTSSIFLMIMMKKDKEKSLNNSKT